LRQAERHGAAAQRTGWRLTSFGYPAAVIQAAPDDSEPLRPGDVPREMPSRSAAAQRRAMQAAMANAVRAMRSTNGRRAGRRRDRS
jgi:hypothetical protein